MRYVNNSHSTKTFYGVTFKPGEEHDVPGRIYDSRFNVRPAVPKEPPKNSKQTPAAAKQPLDKLKQTAEATKADAAKDGSPNSNKEDE